MNHFYWGVKCIIKCVLACVVFSCTSQALLKDTTNGGIDTSLESLPQTPYSYRGVTGGFNVFYDTATKAYVYPNASNNYLVANNYYNGMDGFADSGLLALLYDTNDANSANHNFQAPIVMFGTGVAAKDNTVGSTSAFATLTAKTITTLYYQSALQANVYLIDGTTNTTANSATMLTASMPLVLGTNIFKPDANNAEPQNSLDTTRYNSTTTAALITGIAPSGTDLYKRYTSTGFSNEKIFFYTLQNSYTDASTITTLFQNASKNSANSTATLFYYDYFPLQYSSTENRANPDHVKVGINSILNKEIQISDTNTALKPNTASPTETSLSSGKVFVMSMSQLDNIYDTRSNYFNNVEFISGGNASFANGAIDGFFRDKSTYNIMDSSNKYSTPIAALGVMKYCSSVSCNTTNYYIVDSEYNAGSVKNVAISVPVSSSSIIYRYNDSQNAITTNISGAQPTYIDSKNYNYTQNKYTNSSTPELSFTRQASAILTAAIGAYQKAGVTARTALDSILKNSIPMYNSGNDPILTFADYNAFIVAPATPEDAIGGMAMNPEFNLFNPAFLKFSISDAELIPAYAKIAYTDDNANEKLSKSACSGILNDVCSEGETPNAYQYSDYGDLTTGFTSNDILIYNPAKTQNMGHGTNSYLIIAMNGIYLGKPIAQYKATGVSDGFKTVTAIIYDQTTGGYYYCLTSETTTCTTPSQRIASNTYGLGILNLQSVANTYELLTAKAEDELAIAPSNKLSISAVVVSPVFGNSISKRNLTSTVSASNTAGEKWIDTFNLTERTATAAQSSIFNSVSNLAYSQFSSQNYATSLAGFGSISANFSSNNTNFGVDANNPLNNSRFQDLAQTTSYAINSYGVINERASSPTKLSNIAYSSSIANTHFISRMNFQSGMDLDKVQNFNPMQASSVHYNPFLAFISNKSDAKALQASHHFDGGNIAITTTFGTNNFSGNSIILNTPENSTNIATTVSLNAGKVNDNLGFEGGILRESRTLLGSYSAGALSLGQNNSTIFAKIKATKSLFEGINFIGAFTIGRTTSQNPVGTSLFDGFSPIISRSFVAGLNAEIFGGNLEFTYSQPLAILSGSTVFNGVERQIISFKTTDFEQDFGLSFGKLSKNASISLQALYIQNRGNINSNNTFGGVLRVSKQL